MSPSKVSATYYSPSLLRALQEELQEDRRSPTPARKSCHHRSSPICRLISTVLQDILHADPIIGFEVAAAALKWHRMSRAHRSKDQGNLRLTTLSDHLEAIIDDATTQYVRTKHSLYYGH